MIEKARGFSKNIYFCFIDSLTICITTNCRKPTEKGIPDHLTRLLRNLYAGQGTTVRTEHGTKTGSNLGKEYVKAVYCHLVYITYLKSTLCEMSKWMKHKLESRLLGEISGTSDMQKSPPS